MELLKKDADLSNRFTGAAAPIITFA